MSPITSNKLIYGSILIGSCVILCVAIVASGHYKNYDSNSDSDGEQSLTDSELGKLVRGSAAAAARTHGNQNGFLNHQHQQQLAATRNLYNRQQPMQFAPTQTNRRQYGAGNSEGLEGAGYGPMMGGASQHGRHLSQANSDNDDDEGANFGPNFDSDSDGETNAANSGNEGGQPMNLNQAASGYPAQGDYNDNAGAGFAGDFGPSSGAGYGPSLDGAEYGPSSGGYSDDGRRAKSGSSLMGSRNYGSDDDAGAPQYGPNSAVNSGDNEDDGRAGYAPEGNDNDNDDEFFDPDMRKPGLAMTKKESSLLDTEFKEETNIY